MHLKSLKVFCDIVDLRSFSKAAEANGLSQSGASQAVHHLEDELGVRLIDRSKRPFVLTPEGEIYYAGCRGIVEQYAALEEEVRGHHQAVTGRVRLAAIYSVGLHLMQQCVTEFQALHPQADVRLEYAHPDRVYEAVAADQADVGLVSFPKGARHLTAVAWRTEPIVLACAPAHPLAGRSTVPLSELDGMRAVGFNADLIIRRELDRALQANGATLNVTMEFDNIETIKRAVEIDSGIALLPAPTIAREVDAGTLVAIPVEGVALTRPLGIIHRKTKDLSPTVQRFIAFLQEHETGRATTPDNGAGNGAGNGGAAAPAATAAGPAVRDN